MLIVRAAAGRRLTPKRTAVAWRTVETMSDGHPETSGMNRREFARTGLGALAGFATASLAEGVANSTEETEYLKSAREIARWLESCRVVDGDSLRWPADPQIAKAETPDLYHGVAGVALFWLEAYRATKERRFLDHAKGAANYVRRQIPQQGDTANCGLYTGLAGIGFALDAVGQASGVEDYRRDARGCVRAIQARAKKVGKGVEWDGVTDVIAGAAGIGLYLLHAGSALGDENCHETAVAAGRRIVEVAQPESGGLMWAMTPQFARRMPNFSHGTAGVAYFLATLCQHSKDQAFLDAAIAGAKYLQGVADTQGGICRVFHHEPGGKDLYYLGWCHGPVGTARLFYKLHRATGETVWMDWVRRCARAVLTSGIPEEETPGFWNNVSQCCGSAGVADFFLSLYRITKDREYQAFAERLTADLLARATRDAAGCRWPQAEHRVKPRELVAQTGYMQGAAGVGVLLLRMDALRRGREGFPSLPDSPF
jgi:lantibiotic modifying enzyme